MDFVPSNIIKTPDFGSMAQNAMQQKRQEQKEMNSWIDSNEKKEGAYLEGDKPLVQEAWNKYQSQLDMAIESDSPEAKRKADEAYGEYAQVAGMAIANADQYRTQVAQYKADPSKYSIGGQDFLSLTDEYRRSKRTLNDLTLAVQEPFVLPQSMKYDLANPVDQAVKMQTQSSAKIKDFYGSDGKLNTSAARAHAESMADAFINANESSVEKALAWGGVRSGFAGGEDGIINTMEELEFLRSQPEEKQQEFIQAYKKELVDNFMRNLPGDASGLSRGSGKDYLQLESYGNPLPTSDPDSPVGSDIEFKAFAKPLPGALKNIVGFAFNADGEMVIEESYEVDVRVNGKTEKRTESRIRSARPNEIASIKNTLKRDYGISLSDQKKGEEPAMEQTSEAPKEQPKAKAADPLDLGIVSEEPAAEANTNDGLGLGLNTEPTEATAEPEAEAEEPAREYVMIDDKPYFKDDYDQVAGKKSGRGNYPDTFEEYAESMNVDIMNTKDKPVTNMLPEVTVTADKPGEAVAKEAVLPIEGGGVAPLVKKKESKPLNIQSYYDNLLEAEGGISTDPTDSAAKAEGNQDAPTTRVRGRKRLQHTNKGVTYEVFKNWASKKGIPKKEYHNRFLNLTDDETLDIVDGYTRAVGADNFESKELRALFTQNGWGTGKVWAADFAPNRSPEYRAVLDWLQENTGMSFKHVNKMTKEEAEAIEEFYNKDPKGFIETYTDKKKQHYSKLNTFKQHGEGWVDRAEKLRDALIKDLK